MADLWVDNRHADYEYDFLRRQFTRDQYSGRALEVAQYEADRLNDDPQSENRKPPSVSQFMSEDNMPQYRTRLGYLSYGGAMRPNNHGGYGTYLIRRSQGESAAAFAERVRITRFPAHMAALIDAYVGGIAAVEGAGKWALTELEPLGAHDDPGSIMFRMWNDIDGSGRNWLGALNTAKMKLVVDDYFWSFTHQPKGSHPLTTMIDPDRVVDWHDEDGRPVWVLLAEDVLERPSMHEPAQVVRYYREYDLEGWTKYRVVENNDERELQVVDSEEWKYPFYTDSSRTRKRLPFTRVKLSDMLGRYVGYQMAQDHNALYNILSDARWNFRVINHPRLVIDAEDQQFAKNVEGLSAGANAIQGDAKYISPDSDNGVSAYGTYASEVQQFFTSNHQRMNTPNIERSATEVVYDQAAGRTAFLSIVASAIDEIDNDWRFLSAQIEAPTKKGLWLNSRVERSRDFKPVDIELLAQKEVLSFATAVNSVDAETAAMMAKEGMSKAVMERIRTQGADQVVEEEM